MSSSTMPQNRVEKWQHEESEIIMTDSERYAKINGVNIIADERQRQVSKEGWTPEHDDDHLYGQLAVAAACYAVAGISGVEVIGKGSGKDAWPWESAWDKREKHEPLKLLAIAGALLAAEIDRRLRQASSPWGGDPRGARALAVCQLGSDAVTRIELSETRFSLKQVTPVYGLKLWEATAEDGAVFVVARSLSEAAGLCREITGPTKLELRQGVKVIIAGEECSADTFADEFLVTEPCVVGGWGPGGIAPEPAFLKRVLAAARAKWGDGRT